MSTEKYDYFLKILTIGTTSSGKKDFIVKYTGKELIGNDVLGISIFYIYKI